jgi:dihydropteroate synthase
MAAPRFTFSSLPPGSLMGVLNITPDSFSDGGAFFSVEDAARQARRLVDGGARILDLGAEASSFFRKEVQPTPPEEQLRRLLPVVNALRQSLPETPLSIDTRSAVVAEACLAGGAAIINDISAGTHDPGMFSAVARHRATMVLMHIMPGYPATAPDDADIVGTVRGYLTERIAAARSAGISEIGIDPGVGFGKSMRDNWKLVTGLESLAPPGVPVVLGISRKRFLETPPPVEIADELRALAGGFSSAGHPRDAMTAAVTAFVGPRAALHRVHALLHRSKGAATC